MKVYRLLVEISFITELLYQVCRGHGSRKRQERRRDRVEGRMKGGKDLAGHCDKKAPLV